MIMLIKLKNKKTYKNYVCHNTNITSYHIIDKQNYFQIELLVIICVRKQWKQGFCPNVN